MSLLFRALLVSLAGVAIAAPVKGQRPDDQIAPKSVELQRQAQGLMTAGKLEQADDLLETALAVDPRNRAAYIALGHIAQAQRLPGKAIRFYGQALRIEPNDISALEGQGEAYVQRGAVERARANLARVRTLCGQACPQATQLASAIDRGPPAEVLAAQRPEQGAPREATPPRQN